jgi:hypothetical protein
MSENEIELLPHGFLKKYGSHLHAIRRMQIEAHHQENLRMEGFHAQIKNLDKLLTNEEKVQK